MKRAWIKTEKFLDVALLLSILCALAVIAFPAIGDSLSDLLSDLGVTREVTDSKTKSFLLLPVSLYTIALGLKHLRLFVGNEATAVTRLFSGIGVFLAVQIPVLLIFTLRLDAFFLNIISFAIYLCLRLNIAEARGKSRQFFVRTNRPLLVNGLLLVFCFFTGLSASMTHEVTTSNSRFLVSTVESLADNIKVSRDQDGCFRDQIRVDTTLVGQAAFFSQEYDGTCAAASAMALVLANHPEHDVELTATALRFFANLEQTYDDALESVAIFVSSASPGDEICTDHGRIGSYCLVRR